MGRRPLALWLAVALLGAGLGGCGGAGGSPGLTALIRERRPIGRGPAFAPSDRGPVLGACRPTLGPRFGVHVELFAANRVVVLPAGIGTRPPRRRSEGRISQARCYGDLVTLEPTGVVLVRPNPGIDLADLFRSVGQPLSPRRLAGFQTPANHPVTVFVGGRRWTGAPGAVPLTRHAEIVVEIGPHVPPHTGYNFPPGT